MYGILISKMALIMKGSAMIIAIILSVITVILTKIKINFSYN